MRIYRWRHLLEGIRSKLERTLGLSSKVAMGTVVSLSAASQADMPSVAANAAVPSLRPLVSQDTIRRYHEKFILTPSDSIVVRTDTVWYPRGKRSTASRSSTDPTTPTVPQYPQPVGGGYGGHQSHMSHASHSSHRSGGWV